MARELFLCAQCSMPFSDGAGTGAPGTCPSCYAPGLVACACEICVLAASEIPHADRTILSASHVERLAKKTSLRELGEFQARAVTEAAPGLMAAAEGGDALARGIAGALGRGAGRGLLAQLPADVQQNLRTGPPRDIRPPSMQRPRAAVIDPEHARRERAVAPLLRRVGPERHEAARDIAGPVFATRATRTADQVAALREAAVGAATATGVGRTGMLPPPPRAPPPHAPLRQAPTPTGDPAVRTPQTTPVPATPTPSADASVARDLAALVGSVEDEMDNLDQDDPRFVELDAALNSLLRVQRKVTNGDVLVSSNVAQALGKHPITPQTTPRLAKKIARYGAM